MMRKVSLPGTLSERMDYLLIEADQLRASITALSRDVSAREGIESISHLADVPGDLERAEALMRSVYSALELAQLDAIRGGD